MKADYPEMEGAFCPLPLDHDQTIVLGHGSGGKMMAELISNVFYPPLDNPVLRAGDDAGVVDSYGSGKLAISTDAHVVHPLFFPGGDIGRLAVCGTVNDVAVMGAVPHHLTASFILEEGLAVSTLQQIVHSMRTASNEAGIKIIAGDTKVVEKGKADGLYISTAGVGAVLNGINISGSNARPGDIVICSGTLGDHGIAVLEARGELGFETSLESDVAPLNHLVMDMLHSSREIHVLRDPTRGGAASALNEIARQSGVGITLFETEIPVHPGVQAACEMLGFDPLYIANEGKLVAVVAPEQAQAVLDTMRSSPYGKDAVIIGKVTDAPIGRVLLQTALGSTRVVDVLSGELLPRIC